VIPPIKQIECTSTREWQRNFIKLCGSTIETLTPLTMKITSPLMGA